MKLLVVLAAARLAASAPQHAGMVMPNSAPESTSPNPQSLKATPGQTTTPAGCRKLHTDVDWPVEAEWKKALPEVVNRATNLPKGTYRPDYKVQARTIKDVQDAVKFAAKNNIRLSVITTGHDFMGRNDAPSGLSLDLSLLGGIRVQPEFAPTETGAEPGLKVANVIVPSAGKQAAVTFGVGKTTQQINNAISPSKLVTVGAAHGSVAPAGGFGQTAGHSPISNLYGLATDQFLEFKVVTADGDLKIANKVVNQDLFWALRGGGGSTFGVVVEATVKAHPDIPITLAAWTINSTVPNGDGMWDAYAYLHTLMPDMVEKRQMTAYYYIYPNRIKTVVLHKAEGAGKANAEAYWKPVLEKMSGMRNMTQYSMKIDEYSNFKGYFDARFGAIDGPMKMSGRYVEDMKARPVSRDLLMLYPRHAPGEEMKTPTPSAIANLDSRLLGASHFANPDLARIFKEAAPWANDINATDAVIQGHLVGGGKVFKPDDDTSVLPAWRKAYTHVIGNYIPGKASVNSLRRLAPETGAYANEAYVLNPNWKQTFWGSNYEKLSQIKTKYDPDMMFWASPGINADHMEARDGRACKVAKIVESSTAPITDNLNNGRLITGSIN